MEKLSDKNLLNGGWCCCHCGSHNKVAAARFCGHCGTKRENPSVEIPAVKQPKQTNLKTTAKPKNTTETNRIIADKPKTLSIWDHIRNNFLPAPDRAFKAVIGGACCLLITSVLCGYKMYYSTDTIRLTQTKFSDVSIDHPVYDVCHRLLKINAIGFRKNHELAPYEEISTKEWNHVLNQASKHKGRQYAISAYFSPNEPITVDNLNRKLKALNPEGPELADTSRIQSFYTLEQALFN